MDAHIRHLRGYRDGRVCPCCSATRSKRHDTRLARHRLAQHDAREWRALEAA